MKKFLSGVALFLVPILLVLSVFGVVLYQSGEWHTEEEVAQLAAQGEPSLFGLAYRDNRSYYKHLVAEQKAADLLILGTSRSMQFHSEFFTEPSFYNAGGGANQPHEYRFFLENLSEESLPKTLILVFDQYFFQQGWSEPGLAQPLSYDHYEFQAMDAFRRVMKDWADGKYNLWHALNPPEHVYGMAAVGRGSGFASDGSYNYGSLLDHPERGTDVGFHDSFDRILKSGTRFEWAEDVYQPSLDEFDRLLAFCKEKKIQVVGIIPPYAPSVYLRMQESGHYGYLNKIAEEMRPRMEAYGFELFEFTYMPDTQDAEYIDGYHGGDRVYARLTLELAKQSNILAGMIDTEYLHRALENGENPLRLGA